MNNVKKYVTFICIICMLFTLAPTKMDVRADGTADILEYLTILDKDPAYLTVMASSLVTVDSLFAGDNYVLRDTADMDLIVIEISVLYDMTEEQEAQLRLCLEELYGFFADKPDRFNEFIHYLMNRENFVLPVGDQAGFEELFPTIVTEAESTMYSFTYFMNVMDDFNKLYIDKRGETLFYYTDGYVKQRGNANVLFSSTAITGKGRMDADLYGVMTDTLDNIFNIADENERGMFVNYLIMAGIAGEEVSVDSMQPDMMVESLYDALSPQYTQKNGFIHAFESAQDIYNEYKAMAEQYKMTDKGTEIVVQAMSRAATIKISASDVSGDDGISVYFDGEDAFNFAYVNAQKVRNLFVQNEIPVSKTIKFDMSITFDDADADKAEVFFPESAMSIAANGAVRTYNLVIDGVTAAMITEEIKESGLLNGREIGLALSVESSETKLPDHAKKLNNADVISVNLYSDGDEIVDQVPAGAIKLIITDGKTENNFYAIDSEGECIEVTDFNIENSNVSFSIGEGRMFVYVTEFAEETEPTPTPTTTTKPTTSPTTTPKPSGDSNVPGWGSSGDEDETTSPEPTPTTAPEQSNEPEATPDIPEIEVDFSDVPETHWGREYIYALARRGIISGVGDGMFAPEANITREQFAKILVEAFNLRDDTAQCDFKDVKKGEWYEIYVASAQKCGIINGIGDGLFGVGQNITRQDMAVMITRAAQAAKATIPAKKGMPQFTDYADVSSYATVSIRILTSGDIINGFEDNTFRPFAFATRAQAAKMIYMLILK